MLRSPRILIGGVPFGRDNVGDEAILECVVSIVRTLSPDAEICVSTDDRIATEMKLGVSTCPLYGFEPPGFSQKQLRETLSDVDMFIWSGATGLSDYPEVSLMILKIAADMKKKTAIFCTGMNSELNPFLYNLLAGRRRNIFESIKFLSFGLIDFSVLYESRLKQRAVNKIRHGIQAASLIVLRDEQSLAALKHHIGVVREDILVAADPAIEIRPKPFLECSFDDDIKAICQTEHKKVGICLSAQSPVTQLDELALMFNRLGMSLGVKIIGIPMNPITDAALMVNFREQLQDPSMMCVAEGVFEPDEIAGLAAEMDVVVSSRLHLLILASVSCTPFIGISRGTKITNFTDKFGVANVGSVAKLDLEKLESELKRLLNARIEFEEIAYGVRQEMLASLQRGKSSLERLLISE